MKSTERELTMRYAELLEKEMFDDIVVFPGFRARSYGARRCDDFL